jgi:Predicted membrane protein (DUF2079)
MGSDRAAEGSPQRRRRRSLNSLFVGLLMLLATAAYGAFALYRFYQFNAGPYDLVIFDQAINSYAHFQPRISMVKGLHNGFGVHFAILGDHFSPILVVPAPLYWIYNGPQNLLIALAVLRVIVATANMLGPRPVARDAIILWDGDGSTPPLLAPWVIATRSEVQFTFSTIAEEQTGKDSVAFLEHHGYQVVFDQLGYFALHRGDWPARRGKS